MKTAVLILIVVALALVLTFLVVLAAVMLNEETADRCGRCRYFDRDLRICWWDTRLPDKEEYTKSCKGFEEGENL